ncbi:MAG: hypothetical protein ACAI38_20120 [Myxococcota bacterium]
MSSSASDAVVLALRYQSGILLADGLAEDYSWLLETARTTYPELCQTRAAAHMELDRILVEPVLSRISNAWRDGRIETGIADFDEILEQVGIARIEGFEHIDLFTVQLARQVNAKALADALTDTGNAMVYPSNVGQLEHYTGFVPFARDIEVEHGESHETLHFHHETGTCAVTIGRDGSVGDKYRY